MEINKKKTVKLNNGIEFGLDKKIIIAGPCSIESREHILIEAENLKNLGVDILRGGAFKPRTNPRDFQGLGFEGLEFLKEAGDKYDLPVISEVTSEEYIDDMYDFVDIYQVGARNMYNYELLKKLGKVDKPVLLKRGLSATINEWIFASEYISQAGNDKIIFCERGIRSFDSATRNVLDIGGAVLVQQMTNRPVIADPSHGSGLRHLVYPLAKASLAAGLDGIMVESHFNPKEAMTDSDQCISYDTLGEILKYVR